MADADDDVIFDRDDTVSVGRSVRKEGQLTCNKLLITLILSASFFGLGLCFALPGPTLMDLEENTGSSGGQISLIFTSRSAGYLLGSVVGGVMFDRLNQPCLLSISMVVTSVATAAAPWCTHLVMLAVMIMLQGISMGFLDTGGNLMCLETWGRDNGPHMQALHFSFGIGAFLAPLLASPFLLNHHHNNTNTLNMSLNATVEDTTVEGTSPVESTSPVEGTSPVKYSYMIVATFVFFVALGFITICCCNKKSGILSKSMETMKSEYTIRQERVGFRIQMLVLLFIFYFLYVGAEVTYGSLVSKFAVVVFHWDKQKAAMIASVFWGSFAAGRLLAVFLARCFNPTPMLIVDLVLSTVSLAGLALVESMDGSIISSYMSREVMFWVLTSTLGFGLASIFPTGISWVERYMKVTGKATAVFVVGCALGEMVLPALTGFLFDLKGPMYLMYVLLISSCLSVVVYIVMVNLACSAGERYAKVATQDEDMQPLRLIEDESPSVDFPNGHDAADRKKRVTFVLNSETSLSSGKDSTSSKGSILRSKSVQKKD